MKAKRATEKDNETQRHSGSYQELLALNTLLLILLEIRVQGYFSP